MRTREDGEARGRRGDGQGRDRHRGTDTGSPRQRQSERLCGLCPLPELHPLHPGPGTDPHLHLLGFKTRHRLSSLPFADLQLL